jgi:hypothetical protein
VDSHANQRGIVDARFIALVDTTLESPLGQIAIIPMLAWIASVTKLALSASSLGTKYLNQVRMVTREVRDAATGARVAAADYSQLGWLLISVALIAVALPLATIGFVQCSPTARKTS